MSIYGVSTQMSRRKIIDERFAEHNIWRVQENVVSNGLGNTNSYFRDKWMEGGDPFWNSKCLASNCSYDGTIFLTYEGYSSCPSVARPMILNRTDSLIYGGTFEDTLGPYSNINDKIPLQIELYW
jgi:hypothetical protein